MLKSIMDFFTPATPEELAKEGTYDVKERLGCVDALRKKENT